MATERRPQHVRGRRDLTPEKIDMWKQAYKKRSRSSNTVKKIAEEEEEESRSRKSRKIDLSDNHPGSTAIAIATAVEVENAAAPEDFFWEVEAVIGRRVHNGRVEYLIRWRGCSEIDNTWEPSANLCDTAMEEASKFSKRQRTMEKKREGDEKKLIGAPEVSNNDCIDMGKLEDVITRSAKDASVMDDESTEKKTSRIIDDCSSGHRLSPYEQARLDRIKRNEERLASLGLFDAKKKLKASASRRTEAGGGRQPTTPKKPRSNAAASSAVTPSPPRSSRRLKLEPARYVPTLDDDDVPIAVLRRKVKQKMKKANTSRGYKCDIPMDVSSSPLTEDEKAILKKKMGGDFLGKFEDYLTEVDEISDQNRRNVLRQITKLASGEGIRYESHAYGWPEGCYFMEGINIGPADDILKLMDIGRECEEKWGRDHGNGWLLGHPLKKLYMFQQYHLQQN